MRPAAQPAFSQPLPVRAQVRGLRSSSLFDPHHIIVAVPWAWVILESSLLLIRMVDLNPICSLES